MTFQNSGLTVTQGPKLMVRNLLLNLQLGCANNLKSALVLQGIFKVLLQKRRGGAR